jgi:hypothetical protein
MSFLHTLKLLGVSIDVNIPKVNASQLITNGLNTAYYIIGAIAVIMIIIAGFTMVTSAGEADAIKKAKHTITYSVIGLIFVILAFVITYFITGTFK